MYIYLYRCNILAQFKDIRLTIGASLFSQCDPIVTTIGSKYIWSIRLSLRSGQVSRWTGRSLDKRRANLGGHRYRGGSLEAEGRYTGIGSDRIGSTEREIEHGRSGRGLTVTDAGLALNGLTGIQPLTITIVAIIGPPRLVSRWPPFLSPSLSLSLSPSRSTGLLPPSFLLIRSPSSFLPLTTIATVTRPSSSAFFLGLLRRRVFGYSRSYGEICQNRATMRSRSEVPVSWMDGYTSIHFRGWPSPSFDKLFRLKRYFRQLKFSIDLNTFPLFFSLLEIFRTHFREDVKTLLREAW